MGETGWGGALTGRAEVRGSLLPRRLLPLPSKQRSVGGGARDDKAEADEEDEEEGDKEEEEEEEEEEGGDGSDTGGASEVARRRRPGRESITVPPSCKRTWR